MEIKVDVGSYLKHFTQNQEVIEINGRTIQECLQNILVKYPSIEKPLFDENGKLTALVILNSKVIPPNKFGEAINNKDQLNLVLVIGAG